MPIKPAKAEHIAPTTKENATIPFDPTSLLPFMYKRIATEKTKIESILYSDLRKDIAPSEIFLDIFSILSFPISCLDTQEFFINTNNKAKRPKAGKIFTINSIFNIFKTAVKVIKGTKIKKEKLSDKFYFI